MLADAVAIIGTMVRAFSSLSSTDSDSHFPLLPSFSCEQDLVFGYVSLLHLFTHNLLTAVSVFAERWIGRRGVVEIFNRPPHSFQLHLRLWPSRFPVRVCVCVCRWRRRVGPSQLAFKQLWLDLVSAILVLGKPSRLGWLGVMGYPLVYQALTPAPEGRGTVGLYPLCGPVCRRARTESSFSLEGQRGQTRLSCGWFQGMSVLIVICVKLLTAAAERQWFAPSLWSSVLGTVGAHSTSSNERRASLGSSRGQHLVTAMLRQALDTGSPTFRTLFHGPARWAHLGRRPLPSAIAVGVQ